MVTKEQKKQEIHDYIEKNYSKQDLVKISESEIITNFSDKVFDKNYISGIIDELKREKAVNYDRIKLDILYPFNKTEEIKSIIRKFIVSINQDNNALIAYIITIFAVSQIMPQNVVQAILFPPIVYLAYFVMSKLSYPNTENMIFLKNLNSIYLRSILVSIIVVGIVVFSYSNYILKETVKTEFIFGIIGAGVAIGTVIYKATKKEKDYANLVQISKQ